MENTNQKISTPIAIIVAGFLIMVGIIASKGGGAMPAKEKTLSEQVGVSKQALTACIDKTDTQALVAKVTASVDKAMSHIPRDRRGTPYSIVLGPDGFATEILGAESARNVELVIDGAKEGKIARVGADGITTKNLTELYKGNVTVSEDGDHVLGNPNAQITIIEYSDYECPFCKQFHPTLEKIVRESEGSVKWIYRHYPLHQNSVERLVAAECVGEIKGDDAFWKYSDLLFGLLKTGNESKSDLL